MTDQEKDKLIEWAAKLLDYLHDSASHSLLAECHEWFEEYWRLKNAKE